MVLQKTYFQRGFEAFKYISIIHLKRKIKKKKKMKGCIKGSQILELAEKLNNYDIQELLFGT